MPLTHAKEATPSSQTTHSAQPSHPEYSDAVAKRIEASEARVIKAVFPSNTNHHNTLFGGDALAWMDETAFIAATRFCRKTLVTVSSDRIDFKKPIPAGSLAELIARVIHVGNTSLKVEVNIFVEDMYRDHREHAIRGVFTFVAVDDARNPTQVWTDTGSAGEA